MLATADPPRRPGLEPTAGAAPLGRRAQHRTVQARLGHASASETLDTYSHLWPDSDDRTRAAVDSALGAAVQGGGQHGDSGATGGLTLAR